MWNRGVGNGALRASDIIRTCGPDMTRNGQMCKTTQQTDHSASSRTDVAQSPEKPKCSARGESLHHHVVTDHAARQTGPDDPESRPGLGTLVSGTTGVGQ